MADYTDAFEGTPGATLGSPWVSANSLLPKYNGDGHGVMGNGAIATANAYYNNTTADAHYSYVVHVGDGSNGASGSGVAVRMQSGADSYFYAHYGFGQHMYIGQQIAGSGTDWEDITASADLPTAGQEWGLRVNGTTVEYVVAGVVKKTYTGKNALSGGKAGVIAYSEVGGPTVSNLASWAGGDLSSDAPSSVIADAAITVGNVTSSATGSLSINGDASPSLGNVTSASVADAGWTVAVAWDDLTGEDGYRVKWGTASGTYTKSIDLPANTTTYGIPNLQAGTTYYTRVYGLVGGVEQDPSAEISFTVGVVNADGSIGLGGITVAADGTVSQGSAVIADAAITLGGITLSGAGSLEIVGNATPTLGAITISADGVVSQPGAIVADAAIPIGDIGVTATGTVQGSVTADAANTLSDVLVTARGSTLAAQNDPPPMQPIFNDTMVCRSIFRLVA